MQSGEPAIIRHKICSERGSCPAGLEGQLLTRKNWTISFSAMRDMLSPFLKADSGSMAGQQQWFEGNSEYEHFSLALASDTEAYAGHVARA